MRFLSSVCGVTAMVAVLAVSSARAELPGRIWGAVAAPSAGASISIGTPAAGCLSGAAALPAEGEGFQVLRLSRNRFYGHPDTVGFVKGLGAAAKAEGLGTLLVGDMSQPRGGPMAYGHGSHQNGLDVDIWFRIPRTPLPEAEREAPQAVSMVKGRGVDGAQFSRAQARVLELAARSPEVDRIFVNPAIKQQMCRITRGDRAWLAKLRPWWGHDSHFHVRLACPAGDPACVPQKPIPGEGDGCGAEVASWLAKGQVEIPGDKPNHRRPALPAACTRILNGEGVVDASMR